MKINIPEHVYSLLMKNANYDKILVEKSIKLASFKNDKVTPQSILNEIWLVVDNK